MEHNRFDYVPIIERKGLRLPGDARVALWVVPNIEHFHFDKPSTSLAAMTVGLVPDVMNYGWRDYGARVGIWRLMEVLAKHGVKGTVALNSDVCQRYPQIIEEGRRLGWEWMAHGPNNSTLFNGQSEEDERKLIHSVVETITAATGRRPKGWLGPALTESLNTLDLLAEEGIEYVADWCNDDLPYAMKVRKGSLHAIPYSLDINDIPAFLTLGQSPEQFYQMIVDQFDVLYEEGARTPRIMAICLHPFLIGHAYRSKHLDRALHYITNHAGVWCTTGSEIIDWYKAAQS